VSSVWVGGIWECWFGFGIMAGGMRKCVFNTTTFILCLSECFDIQNGEDDDDDVDDGGFTVVSVSLIPSHHLPVQPAGA
jgi:hypothetical protein